MKNTPNYKLLVVRYNESGQWERSLATARDWLAADPENAGAHRAAAQSLVNLDKAAEAEKFIAKALSRRPDDDFVQRLASIAHFKLGRPREADEAIHRAISLNPTDSGHWRHLAWMSYVQGDHASARKWAEKARSLSPRDPNVLNLLSLCQPKGPEGQSLKETYLREALELRPNDPNLQNNLGVNLMNVSRDFAAAEMCFRRALSANPASKLYRKNLFSALKGRDPIYKALCAPRDLILRALVRARRNGRERLWLLPLILLAWLLVARYMIGALILWLILVWPLVKTYEYLTLGDLKKKAGEIGAQRGGFLGFRRWPLRARLAIFGLVLVGFWTALALAARNVRAGDALATYGLLLVIIVLCGAVVFWAVRRNIRFFRAGIHKRRRSKKFSDLLQPGNSNKALSHE